MLDTKERYVLQKFPIVVDPLVQSLEVLTTKCVIGAEGRPEPVASPVWKQLQRVRVSHDTFPFSIPSSMVTFFGPESRPSLCPYMLVYDAAGVLRFRIENHDREFVAHQLPEEINGRVALLPSVRISFSDIARAKQFLAVVEGLQDGQALDTPTLDFLGRLLKASQDAIIATVGKEISPV